MNEKCRITRFEFQTGLARHLLMNPNVTVNRSVEAVESLQWIGDEETDVHQEWNTIQANVRRQKGPSFSAASGAVAAVSARAGCP